ncbi:MAG TPA: hypothetical protein VMH79_10980 [Thermoanaerobaculia bacterium]|nr:hypothetical protein [Thermoanaerobaculia bacterium]
MTGRRRRRGDGIGLALVVIAAFGCASATPTASTAAAPARATSSFGQNLSLGVTLGRALTEGDTTVTARFALKNNGSATFEGCFGPSWGVSVIVGQHDAGHVVSGAHPGCHEKLTLAPGQTIVWSKPVPLGNLRAGTARVTAWVKVIDPVACGQRTDCHEVSVASPSMTVGVAAR